MSELRQNLITGDWVVIAPKRAKRPNQYAVATEPILAPTENCPFCPHSSEYHHRLHYYDSDHVFILPNKFPAFTPQPELYSSQTLSSKEDFYLTRPAIGGHDVAVIKDHSLRLATFTRPVWRDLLTVIKARYRHYQRNHNTEYVMAIYNEQKAAGASIVHPHAQIFAFNVIPNIIACELRQTAGYLKKNGVSAFVDLIKHEQKVKTRVVAENDYFIAVTQFAARYPFETWIIPKDEVSHFDRVDHRQISALVIIFEEVFGRINRALNCPPLNFYIHSAPNSIQEVPHYRWHVEIVPRLSTFGGFELGSGVIIDTISPELAAEHLKQVKL